MLLSLIIILFAMLWFTNRFDQREDEITWKKFESIIDSEKVRNIIITQNKAVPTGRVQLTLRGDEGDEICYLYVSDVNDIQDYLQEKNISYVMPDIPQDNWFATTILPVLITVGALLVIFSS